MIIEQKIFKRAIFDFDKLEKYGFVKSGGFWHHTEFFMADEFKAVIYISAQGNVSGTVYEVATDEEYLPLRVENMEGFAATVRTEYIKILENIKAKCCRINHFVSAQANRAAQFIYQTYGDLPAFPWDKFNRHGVFKNTESQKWYALILCIDKSKLNAKLSGEIEVMNIKLNEDKILDLHKQNGFYPAYHMNKKSWITITLDDSVTDSILFDLIAESHTFSLKKAKPPQKTNKEK